LPNNEIGGWLCGKEKDNNTKSPLMTHKGTPPTIFRVGLMSMVLLNSFNGMYNPVS
jgi:hypothetical protein